MADTNISKCPYCGSSMLEEEDGYRCRFCKSYFPFEAEPVRAEEKKEPYKLSLLKPQIVEDPENGIDAEAVKEEKEFQRLKTRNELIGMAAAFVSVVFMALCKLMKIPLLMIPGFVFWAFAAGFTGIQIIKSSKAGRRTLYLRVIFMLVIAILMLLFLKPRG